VGSLVLRWVRVATCLGGLAMGASRVEARNQSGQQGKTSASTLRIERADGGSVDGVRVRIHCPTASSPSPSDRIDPFLDAVGESFDLPADVQRAGDFASVVVGPWRCPTWDYDPRAPIIISARLRGWRGRVVFGDPAPSKLVLHPVPDRTLSVRVVGASGEAVDGAPVRLVAPRELAGAKLGVRYSGGDRAFAWSAVDGLARFERVDVVRWDRFGGGEMFVQVEAFPRTLRPTALVPRESKGGPIVLDASRLSALALEAVERNGARLGAVNQFALVYAPESPGESRESAGSVAVEARPGLVEYTDESFYAVAGHDGAALAPWTARDARLVALTRRNMLSDWSGTILEPIREAHTHAIQLVPGAACEALALEVAGRGAPAPSSQLRFRRLLRLQSPQTRLEQFATELPALLGVATNETQQRVLAVWSEWASLSDAQLHVDLDPRLRRELGLIQVEHSTPDGALRVGMVDVRARPPSAEHRVQVDLTPNEQWVSVVVVDPTGRGIPRVEVTLETRTSWRLAGGDLNTVFETPALTAADGRIDLQLSVDGVHRLRATGVDLGDAVAEGVVPGSEVRLTLGGRSSVKGRLRAVGLLGVADLNLLLMRERHWIAETHWSGRTLGCSCDGEFEFPDVFHGRYTLIVRRAIAGGPPRELARLEGVDVRGPGEFDVGELLVSD